MTANHRSTPLTLEWARHASRPPSASRPAPLHRAESILIAINMFCLQNFISGQNGYEDSGIGELWDRERNQCWETGRQVMVCRRAKGLSCRLNSRCLSHLKKKEEKKKKKNPHIFQLSGLEGSARFCWSWPVRNMSGYI